MKKHFFIRIDGILTVMTAFFLLAGCQKDKKQEYHYIPDYFKEWSIYKPGSYWIYLNEMTDSQDCTYVIRYHNFLGVSGDEYITYHIEHSDMTLDSVLFSSFDTWAGFDEDPEMDISTVNQGGLRFTNENLVNPKITTYSYYDVIYKTGVFAVYPAETVNGNNFTNVYDLHYEEHHSNGDSVISEGHLVKNVGIVKYRYFFNKADTIWSLVRWKVIQ